MSRLPVTLIFYRRPDCLRSVLATLRVYRPDTIFAVSDGARPGDQAGEDLVGACRALLASEINWPCRVEKIFAPTNLGLRERVESGLDEVFQRTPFSVILEEDCAPRADFFPFVEAVRSRWEGNERIGGISGSCFLPVKFHPRESYFFSRYPHIWGWATWARCWHAHNRGDSAWPLTGGVRSLWPDMNSGEALYWEKIFSRVYSHQLETWDYRWLLSCWRQKWVAATPSENLVENIGFGKDATNTSDPAIRPGVERVERLSPPWKHPAEVERDAKADEAVFKNHYLRMEGRLSFWPRLLRSLRKRI